LNKKIVIIFIVAIIGIFLVNFSSDTSEEMNDAVFHVTLADPNLYINGVYAEKFTIDKGQYSFRFVPNGSSPEILSISINGENFDFSENFKLQNTLHETEISEYFTWEYEGEKIIEISEIQKVSIIINPNGNVLGSVSVDILEN
jgi:trehalose/maltose hydrolase-like predicted phosphorylase